MKLTIEADHQEIVALSVVLIVALLSVVCGFI